MSDRRRPHLSGPRLPLGPRTAPAEGCIRIGDRAHIHDEPIRFDLVRYGKVVGQILLCGGCFRDVAQLKPADPLIGV